MRVDIDQDGVIVVEVLVRGVHRPRLSDALGTGAIESGLRSILVHANRFTSSAFVVLAREGGTIVAGCIAIYAKHSCKPHFRFRVIGLEALGFVVGTVKVGPVHRWGSIDGIAIHATSTQGTYIIRGDVSFCRTDTDR